MTDALLFIVALVGGAYLWHILRRVPPEARIVLPGSPMHRPDHAARIPWHTPTVPIDATHIAWIMHGAGDLGSVHTLYLQTLDSLRSEINDAKSPWGPIIAHSLELEFDIRGRGCVPTSEVLYAVARIDSEGNELWLADSGAWVPRWSDDATIFEVFPGQVR
jgi:hypothetical protein